jgi:hypothetical protein
MDNAEIAAKFALMEATITALAAELAALRAERLPAGKVIGLKEFAYRSGCSVETARRKILHDPAWRKIGARWSRDA